jgi:two-component system LytT family response regulator
MPGKNGFHLAEHVDISKTKIIFITAYNQYAIKAFKYSATDYLLKPVDISELRDALNRAVNSFDNNFVSKDILSHIYSEISEKKITKLAIQSIDCTEYIDINDILRLEADGSYTKIFITDQTIKTASKNLKEFESLLEEEFFVRVHNSHIVNINYLKKYNKKDGFSIILQDGSCIPVAIRKKNSVEMILNKLSR